MPWPSAVHETSVVPTVKVQLKLTDWPGARLPVKAPAPLFFWEAAAQFAHEFVPVTLTPVSVSSPTLDSRTVIVTWVPWRTLVGTLTRTRVVAGAITMTAPS